MKNHGQKAQKVPTAKAKARPKKPFGQMNKTEQWYYDNHIVPKITSGGYRKALYERITFVVAEGNGSVRASKYTPDFYCIRSDDTIEIIEIKGFWREDDRIKLKVVAEQFPEFHWKAVTISSGKIKKEEVFS